MAERVRQHIPYTILPIIMVVVFSIAMTGCFQEKQNQVEDKAPTVGQIEPSEKPVSEVSSSDALDESEAESAATESSESLVEYVPTPETLDERFSYTYGYLLMATAMRDVQSIDPVYFARGAYDAGLQKTPLIEQNQMNTVLYEYQDKLISEAARRLEELAQKNLEDAESFLAVNGKREGVETTGSGLQYEVLVTTEGERPTEEDTVRVNYRLTYLDGREGDASIRGIPSTFDLTSMIPGFREGLLLMPVGSEYRFYVHPDLGYGAEGSTRIEPNTLLIFDVELVEIVQ